VKGNIGTAIEASAARQRLQEVLVETQQLNEELQVQQEELRTANEELEEQSRVLEGSQASLENQKAELEQTNEQLAEQANRWTRRTPSCKGAAGWKSARELSAPASTSRIPRQYVARLRTPLNSSLILAKLLAENAQATSTPSRYVRQSIYSAGNDLLNLINDILDISKVEAGKLDLVPEACRRATGGGHGHGVRAAGAAEKLAFELQVADTWPGHGDRPPAPGADPQEPAVQRAQVHQHRPGQPVGAGARRGAWRSRCAIPASASAPKTSKASSTPSSRPMAPPAASTAAPAWACRFRATWRTCWAGDHAGQRAGQGQLHPDLAAGMERAGPAECPAPASGRTAARGAPAAPAVPPSPAPAPATRV
jgi:hypothetical protein